MNPKELRFLQSMLRLVSRLDEEAANMRHHPEHSEDFVVEANALLDIFVELRIRLTRLLRDNEGGTPGEAIR